MDLLKAKVDQLPMPVQKEKSDTNWLLVVFAVAAFVFIQIGTTIFAVGVFSPSANEIAGIRGIPETVKEIVTAPPATDKDEQSRSIAAQEAMATFAFWMLVTAILTALVTTFGTFAIFKQIKFGQQAIELSKNAAAQASDNSERQLRAYLNLAYDPDGGPSKGFAFILQNSGQTPALNLFYHIVILYYSNSDGVVAEIDTDDFDWLNLAAGEKHIASVRLPKPFLLPDGTRAPDHDFIRIEIECTYRTVFGKEHKSSILVNRRGWSDFWMEDESVIST